MAIRTSPTTHGGGRPQRLASLRDFWTGLRPQHLATGVFGLSVVMVLGGLLGLINGRYGVIAIALAAAIFLVGLASLDIGLIPVMAFPATLLMMRTGPLSVSDLALIAAVLPAVILYNSKEAGDMRQLLWLGFIYQACLVPTLLLHPYGDNIQEWAHEAALVLGSLVVGWVVGRRDQYKIAVNLYIIGCLGIGVATVIVGLIGLAQGQGLSGVYLPYLHKNFIGNSLAFAFLMVFVRPEWMGWSPRLANYMLLVLGGGVVFSGARQSLVSIAVALGILALRSRADGGGKARTLMILAIPAMWYVVSTVIDQVNSGNAYNSASQRLLWFRDSITVWEMSPIFGYGLRWWYRPDSPYTFQPPNAFLEMLTSGGILGLAGFIVLCVGGVWVVFRLDPRYGNIALVGMTARMAQGQLDLYWVAGQSAFLWMVAGMAYGIQALERARGIAPDGESDWQTGRAPGAARTH